MCPEGCVHIYSASTERLWNYHCTNLAQGFPLCCDCNSMLWLKSAAVFAARVNKRRDTWGCAQGRRWEGTVRASRWPECCRDQDGMHSLEVAWQAHSFLCHPKSMEQELWRVWQVLLAESQWVENPCWQHLARAKGGGRATEYSHWLSSLPGHKTLWRVRIANSHLSLGAISLLDFLFKLKIACPWKAIIWKKINLHNNNNNNNGHASIRKKLKIIPRRECSSRNSNKTGNQWKERLMQETSAWPRQTVWVCRRKFLPHTHASVRLIEQVGCKRHWMENTSSNAH